MKKLYWRPTKVSRTVLSLIAVVSLFGMVSVERFQVLKRQPHFKEKIAAAKLTKEAFQVLKKERLRRGIPIDPEVDPAQTGLIGMAISSITSFEGYLPAKQTSINPNFAAVLVQLLREAGVRSGDAVALGLSGSFPAVNVAVYAAAEILKLKPVIISSAAASQWGANHRHFSWLDMEQHLFRKKIFSFRSATASLGGIEDRGWGMTKKGRQNLKSIVERNGLPLLEVQNYEESVAKRMALYKEQAGGLPIRAYVNVGGGTSSVGKRIGKHAFQEGLVLNMPAAAQAIDSVMAQFRLQRVPVLHLVNVRKLAEKYGLPLQPDRMPGVGEGGIFMKEEPSKLFVLGFLGLILLSLFAFVRTDLGFRIVQTFQGKPVSKRRSEKMA
ncbi:MAG: poly-gamma-glutamate system protein [Deltaproteobacteria bacterium]|nr:poly-gamma-glutamate system protein [Deltaproteobacteria bacterium]